jgi:hypothetical protein
MGLERSDRDGRREEGLRKGNQRIGMVQNYSIPKTIVLFVALEQRFERLPTRKERVEIFDTSHII